MKYILSLLVLLALASCGATSPVPENNPETPVEPTPAPQEQPADEEILNQIDTQTGVLDTTAQNEVKTLDASYKDPNGQVSMTIEYSLNADNTIKSIKVGGTGSDVAQNFMQKFDTESQALVGKTLEDAASFSMAGSSLTSDAFQKAIKNI